MPKVNGHLQPLSLSVGTPPAVVFEQAALSASLATVATVPAGKNWADLQMTICNQDSVVQLVIVHLVPSGGSASATNKILAMYMDIGYTLVMPINVLADGTTIQASGTNASMTVSGWQS